MEYIKVNLPATEEAYINGNGDGVFMLVSEEVKKAYDSDENGTIYKGILDNDSIYYNGLYHGEELIIEMRGDKRPVVPYNYLIEHFEVNKNIWLKRARKCIEFIL